MAYLICEKCGGYYELEEGESHDKFSECQCGGKLRYSESLYGKSNNKSLRSVWNEQTITIKILVSVISVFLIVGLIWMGMYLMFPHYESADFSFDYPMGWSLGDNPSNTEYVHDLSGSKGFDNKFSIQKTPSSEVYDLVSNGLLTSNMHSETITIGGISAYKFTEQDADEESIRLVFFKDDFSYFVQFSGNKDDINQMVDSFVRSFHINYNKKIGII